MAADSKAPTTAGVLIQMLLVACGLYASFFWWSLLQERVVTIPYMVDGVPRKFNFVLVINAVQFFFSALVGLLFFSIRRIFALRHHHHHHQHSHATGAVVPPPPSSTHWASVPFWTALSIGLTNSMASPFGYAAMKHVSFPMVLTLKMCKMVPIAIIGALVHRTTYSLLKYVDILLITGGVILFMLLDPNSGHGKSSAAAATTSTAALASVYGAVLCFINLTFDGFTNSSQDNVVKTRHASSFQVMVVSNGASLVVNVALLYILEWLPVSATDVVKDVFQPQLYAAFQFIAEQPAVVNDVVLMGALCAMGQVFIFVGMETFGSLTTTAMTVTRKVGSVGLSILVHGHAVSSAQLAALVAVVAGLFLDAYLNVKEKKAKHKAA